jgi:acetoin utilization protein AcuB
MDMLVKGWMNMNVVTVPEAMAMVKASMIMMEKRIRALPVMNKKGRLVGIVTDRDLKKAFPSIATNLNVHELNYLTSRVKVKDIMTTDLVVVKPDETIEFAAILMLDNKISSLPVINENDSLVGIITQTDIFKVLVQMTGIRDAGIQFAFSLEDRPGSIKEVANEIEIFGARIASTLSTRQNAESGHNNVYMRIHSFPRARMEKLAKALERKFTVLYSACDDLDHVETRRIGVSHTKNSRFHSVMAGHINRKHVAV